MGPNFKIFNSFDTVGETLTPPSTAALGKRFRAGLLYIMAITSSGEKINIVHLFAGLHYFFVRQWQMKGQLFGFGYSCDMKELSIEITTCWGLCWHDIDHRTSMRLGLMDKDKLYQRKE